jgi:hypothetical protein
VSGLTDGDIWRLDIFEGSDYTRKRVKVRVLKEGEGKAEDGYKGQGEEVEAETYIWTASPDALEEEEWDFEEFVREKMSRWVGSGAAETDDGFKGE